MPPDAGANTAGFWAKLLDLADRAAAALEAKWFLFIFIFADVYLLVTAIYAQRPMWFDELFTFYMCQLPSMSAVWAALKDGADLNPPLFYVVTRAFQALFGHSAFTLRLPAIIGSLVMMLCVFRFVSRYGSRLAGLAAMTFPLLTGAYYFSHEARAYGMVLGFTGLAAVLWQSAGRNEQRNITLPGLAAALTGALLSHCYAVLVLVPFALGEAARIASRRKLDWPMLTSLAVPCLAVLSYIPMFNAANQEPLDNPVFRSSIRAAYEMILMPAFWPLIAALTMIALASARRSGSPARESVAAVPHQEMALAGGFVLIPVCASILATTVTRIFMDRYGLVATIGFSILLGALIATRLPGSRIAAAIVPLLFLGAFAFSSAGVFIGAGSAPSGSRTNVSGGELRLADLPPGIPIVIADPILFLEFDHYESKDFTDRIYFLTDRVAALQYTGTTGHEAFYRLRRWFPIRSHIEDYRQFLSNHSHFMILTRYDFALNWAMQKMIADGVPLSFKGQFFAHHGSAILAEVSAR